MFVSTQPRHEVPSPPHTPQRSIRLGSLADSHTRHEFPPLHTPQLSIVPLQHVGELLEAVTAIFLRVHVRAEPSKVTPKAFVTLPLTKFLGCDLSCGEGKKKFLDPILTLVLSLELLSFRYPKCAV